LRLLTLIFDALVEECEDALAVVERESPSCGKGWWRRRGGQRGRWGI